MLKGKKIIVLLPVYKDWFSFSVIANQLSDEINLEPAHDLTIIAVNDGSIINSSINSLENTKIEIIHLSHNMGHQKAIAIGLSYIADNKETDYIVVMDSDGEDNPNDVVHLLEEADKKPENVIFARRKKRKENFIFKFFYLIYKSIYFILTGKSITFGNFSIIPKILLNQIVHIPEIWNHYSASISKFQIPYSTISTNRETRISGKSKMKLPALIFHGLRSISVWIDIVSIRLLIFIFILILLSIFAIIAVIGIRLFTEAAIPGWATYFVLGLTTILMQAFLIVLVLIFMIISNQSENRTAPIFKYKEYIFKIDIID